MRAPQPEPPIPGSFATPSLLAWIVNGKYVMSLPLYRIETDCISSSRCFVFSHVFFSGLGSCMHFP
ncbi:hypothetical protein, partial [Bifidobacterium longum]|uniref:hypothetical protein n=1 Tax=Bifidobacterium longum TaxID=216816 RepID=UPI0032D520C6